MPLENLTRGEAAIRALLVSNVSYELRLVLSGDPDATTFASTCTLRFDCAEEGGATFLDLEADEVVALELNGRRLDPTQFHDHRVHLSGLARHNQLRVDARCRYQHTGVGMHRVVDPADGHVYLYTHFEPFDAHQVMACFDQPDIKATWSLTVVAPSEWEVVSNAPVEDCGQPIDGQSTVRFGTTPRISSYLVAVVAGPYHSAHRRHGELDMGLYVRRSLAAHLDQDELFAITAAGLDFFAEVFGIPYPFAKYDQLFVPEFNMGAMENPGCITFNDAYIFRSRVTRSARSNRANTILHEMAHMWFGDYVTMRWWDDLWLNESFATVWATYAKDLATDFEDSWVDFAYAEKGWAMRQDQLPSTHPVAADMPDTESVRLNFDGITYAKGASVLRQLVAYVGYDEFVAGLRAYFARHAWANATFADLLAALEQSSGRELRGWADQWLSTSGINAVRSEFSLDERGRFTSFAVLQEAAGTSTTLRAHRMNIGLYSADHNGVIRRSRVVEVEVDGARTEVGELTGAEAPDLIMLNDDDLTFTKVRLDSRSADTLVEHMSDLESPLARALGWACCWDMTRDAELPARRYVELVARHAARETETTVLERLLLQASSAVELYGDPANRPEARARLNHAAEQAMRSMDAGSDLQLVWARSFIATAEADPQLTFLRALLEGTDRLEGLVIDTDLRWAIVVRLAATGRASEALIDAELERDATDIGRRRAAAALAARPTAAAKEAAWREVTEGVGLPLRTMAAIIGGFEQPGQDELLGPYLERYAAAVAGWWRDRTPDEAEELTALYPSFRADHAVIDAADQILADAALGASARRLIIESRDGTQRAQRARAADAAATELSPAMAD